MAGTFGGTGGYGGVYREYPFAQQASRLPATVSQPPAALVPAALAFAAVFVAPASFSVYQQRLPVTPAVVATLPPPAVPNPALYQVRYPDEPLRVRMPFQVFEPPAALSVPLPQAPASVFVVPPINAYWQPRGTVTPDPLIASGFSIWPPLYVLPYPDAQLRLQARPTAAVFQPAPVAYPPLPTVPPHMLVAPSIAGYWQPRGIVVDAGLVAGLTVPNPALYQVAVPWWLFTQTRPIALGQPAAALVPPILRVTHPAFIVPYPLAQLATRLPPGSISPITLLRIRVYAQDGPLYVLSDQSGPRYVVVDQAGAAWVVTDQSQPRYGLSDQGGPASTLEDTST